jgi:hypothetical protein
MGKKRDRRRARARAEAVKSASVVDQQRVSARLPTERALAISDRIKAEKRFHWKIHCFADYLANRYAQYEMSARDGLLTFADSEIDDLNVALTELERDLDEIVRKLDDESTKSITPGGEDESND